MTTLIIVPASGPLMSKADLQAMRDMYDTIFQRISSGFRAANSVEVTLSEMPTAEFDARNGGSRSSLSAGPTRALSPITHLMPDGSSITNWVIGQGCLHEI